MPKVKPGTRIWPERAFAWRHGWKVYTSKKRISERNLGGYKLVDATNGQVLAGASFELTLDELVEEMEHRSGERFEDTRRVPRLERRVVRSRFPMLLPWRRFSTSRARAVRSHSHP